MSTIEKSVDVRVPVTRAYHQWTQFESFPSFMTGVERVMKVNDTLTHWETSIGGVRREFDAEITEQLPDERVAWKTVDGSPHGGVVTFHPLDDETTRIHARIEYDPETVAARAGAAFGVAGHRVHRDLVLFKELVEGGATAHQG